jgi:hypothetical protein
MAEDKRKIIVIANKKVSDYLLVIGLEGMNNKILVLQYSNAYADKVEYILRILRKSFGWLDSDRDRVPRYNLVCKYKNEKGHCSNPVIMPQGDGARPLMCTEPVRTNCKAYVKRYSSPFVVNEVKIEQAGSIADL